MILLAFRSPANRNEPLGPPWVEESVRDITSLGSAAVMILVTLSALGFLMLQKKWRWVLFIMIAVGGGVFWEVTLKRFFARPRPDLFTVPFLPSTYSFPSGHSMTAAVVYLTLGVLISQAFPQRAVKVYIVFCAILLAVLVGISRIYLGVHWPTDVLAGLSAGGAWALLCWLLNEWFISKGYIQRVEEREGDR